MAQGTGKQNIILEKYGFVFVDKESLIDTTLSYSTILSPISVSTLRH